MSGQAERELEIELVVDTQRPELLNGSLTGGCTGIILMRLMDDAAIRSVQKILLCAGISADAAQLCRVPPGVFTAFNRISGGSLAGRVF